MSALTKIDLVNYLFEKIGLNKSEAKIIVECFFEEIILSLEQGIPIKLSGFGTFDTRVKKMRMGRNPKTGIDAVITKRRVVTFRASQQLKDSIEGIK